MKRFSAYCACVALSLAFQAEVFFQAEAQDFKYDWSVIPVTDKYDLPAGTPVAEIVAEAREGMTFVRPYWFDSLQRIRCKPVISGW